MMRSWLGLCSMTIGVLLIGVNGGVPALAAPFIARDLHASAVEILWIGDVYSFVLAGLLITMGGLGDEQ